MRAQIAVAFVVALAFAPRAADATPSDDLAQARKAFREGNYKDALRIYNDLVRPRVQLADSNDIVEAYVNLGVCRVETGDDDGAKQEFEKALSIDANKQLDPLLITNKRAIQLFDDTKTDLRVRAEREKNARREADERDRLRKLRASLIGVKENPRYLAFFPFGVGQFQNGDVPRGLFFAGGQALGLTTSVGIWYYLVNKYGFRSDKVPREDVKSVLHLQWTEAAAGTAFWLLWAWSVVDANLHYQHVVRAHLDESLMPPELRDQPPAKPKQPPKTSFHIIPMVTPDGTGAGIGIGWEN